MSEQTTVNHDAQATIKTGILYALGAYVLWGIIPVYFKQLGSVSPMEVLTHRVIWSVLVLFLLLMFTGGLSRLKTILQQPKVLAALFVTAAIISLNWLIFIWAVSENRILETSLGYFINPLVSIFMGMIFLSERLRPAQWLAISLAGAGVAYQLILHGSLPWVALVLAFSFGFYGLLRKQIPVDAISGLFIETLMMLPAALAYLLWLAQSGTLIFAHQSLQIDLLLMAAGLITSIPLLFFAGAARRLSLTLIGFIQYIAPSITFILAVFVYGESLDNGKLTTFALIWLALIVFSLEGFWSQKRRVECSA